MSKFFNFSIILHLLVFVILIYNPIQSRHNHKINLSSVNLIILEDPIQEKIIKLNKNRKKIEQNPNNWKNHFKIAFGYYFKKNKLQSIKSFEEVIKIEPNQVWAMGFIALIKGEIGDLEEAYKITKNAIKIQPDGAGLHFLLAEIL